MAEREQLFSITISARRKPGMDEDAYHRYISETHASHLKDLLVRKKIVDYTMQHNTSKLMSGIDQLFPNLPSVNRAQCDAYVTIVFRNVQDYIDVKNDSHYLQVVNADHGNFADSANTLMSFGWFERHVANGQLVKQQS